LTKPERLPLLTSLRFFAAAEVLIFHACGTQLNDAATPTVIRDLFHNAYEAVTFFFLLSGFVLTYAHRQAHDLASGAALRRYYFGRIARIYPVYLLALLIAAPQFIYEGMRAINPLYSASEFASSLMLAPMLLQTWYPPAAALWVWPAWSLSVEAAFYVVLPFLVPRLLSRPVRQQLAISLTLLGTVEVLRIWLSNGGAPWFNPPLNLSFEFLHYHFWLFAPVFMLGSALAGVYAKYPPTPRAASLMFNSAGALILGLFCCRSSVPPWALSNVVLAPLFAVLVLGATAAEGLLPRLLSTPYMVLLGNASYALYLLHLPLLHCWQALDLPLPPEVFCLIAVIVSVICYQYVETPVLRWSRRLINRREAVVTLGASAAVPR
jgi:peptidoglycan/LPS O-acetylase OafA/YrhL